MSGFPFLESYRKSLPKSVLDAVKGAASSPAAILPGPSVFPPVTVALPFRRDTGPGPVARDRAPSRAEGTIAFVPAALAKADLPNLSGIAFPMGLSAESAPEILFRRVASSCAVVPVKVSREERRLEQRRRARAEAEAEARAETARRVSAVDTLLRRGGLWRAEDLAPDAGITVVQARAALDALSAGGLAVHVALGHWRSRLRAVQLCQHGLTPAARALGFLLHGLSLDAETIAFHAGVYPDQARAAVAELCEAGHVQAQPDGTYLCPEAARLDLIEMLGPAPLSGLCARVLDDLFGAGPSRKVEVATRLGVGRGSINRTVERLVEDGWVARAGADLFSVAA